MKHFLTVMFAMFTFGAIADAHAQWWYYETPPFYSAEYPSDVKCRYDVEASDKYNGVNDIYDCYPQNLTASRGQVLLTDDTGQIYTKTVALTRKVGCEQGLCTPSGQDTFLGKLTPSSYTRSSVYGVTLQVMQEYYIHNHPETGEVYAYRNGTGPLADAFQLVHVDNDQGAFYHSAVEAPSTPIAQTDGVYDLWCNPRGDFCDYTDGQGIDYRLGRDELLNHIPIASDTSDCYMEVCHNANMDVVGLNPSYHLFN